MSVAGNMLSNALGNISKGALIIRKATPKDEMKISSANMPVYEAGNLTAAGETASAIIGELGKKDKIVAEAKKKGYIYYEFQYNPEKIHINANQGSYQQRQGAPESGINQLTTHNIPAQSNLTFQLVLCDINNQDAFTEDKLLVTSIKSVTDKISAITGDQDVSKEAEGLVSLLMWHATRQVIFVFGKMLYRGELEKVSVDYRMFSPSGRPIYAVVSLSIRQVANNEIVTGQNQKYDLSLDDGYWDAAFEEAFGKPYAETEVDFRPAEGMLGGLVNLNM